MPPKEKTTVPAAVVTKVRAPGQGQWEIGKRDVPLRLLIPPQRLFRGLHNDTVEALKPMLQTGWSSSFNMCALEDKSGGPNLEVIDGNHRLTALRELWTSGDIDGDYLVGVSVFKKETPDAVLMEKADSVNTANETYQQMTLVDKLYFLRQVFARMDEARLDLAKKTRPTNMIFQSGTVWDISAPKMHEYLYNNKNDSHTQKLVGLFRSFFGPADYFKGNIEQAVLNRIATLWNQLHWLNERSPTWWAYFRNALAKSVTAFNVRARSSDWKKVGIPAVELGVELNVFNTEQVVSGKVWIDVFKGVLKSTGLLVLNSVYPGVFLNKEYDEKSTQNFRPKFEYIAQRAFLHFAVTGKLATREQFLAYKDEVASEEVFSRFRLWETLENTRKAYDNTIAGSLWCTAWAAALQITIHRCAWPACRGLLEDNEAKALASYNVQGCSVCMTYFACLDCTKTAFENNLPNLSSKLVVPSQRHSFVCALHVSST